MIFANNSAFRGGALQLSNTQLYLLHGTHLVIDNNLADEYGGALYIYDNPLISIQTDPVCFAVYKISNPQGNIQPQVVLRNNKAKVWW